MLHTPLQLAVCSEAGPTASLPDKRTPRTPLAASSPALHSPTPVPTQAQLQQAHPSDIWACAGTALNFSVPPTLLSTFQPTSSSPDDTPLAPDPQQLPPAPGRFYVAAQVWPAAKLPKGLVIIAGPLSSSLGRPPPGSRLGLYRCATPRTAAAPDAAAGAAAIECGKVYLRLCLDASEPGLLAVEGEGRQQQREGAAAAAPAVARSPSTPK